MISFWDAIYAWWGASGISPWPHTLGEYRILVLSKLRNEWMHTASLLSAIAAIGGKHLSPEQLNPIPDPVRGEYVANALDFLELVYAGRNESSSNPGS